MITLPAYDRDPYLKALETRILRVDQERDYPFAVLEDTILYPEGGGQPADGGLLDSIPVLDVQKREGELRHYLAGPAKVGPTRVALDWDRRFDHMQQHTGQHLLTALAQDRLGWATTAFHLGESRCDIELATESLDPEQMEELENAVAEVIREGRKVGSRWVTAEDFATLKVRSRGLPEGHTGAIRLVEIEGLDLNTCGGTHLRSTAELEVIKLLGTEPIRGGTRLFFVAGQRARKRMGAHEQRNAALRTLLGAPDEELIAGVEAKLAQLQASERRLRRLEEHLAEALVGAWAADADPVQDHHLEGQDGAFLGRVARGLVAAAPAKVAFLTGEHEGQAAFVLAAGAEVSLDLAALGGTVAALLGGRGGGRAPIFQGKAGSLKGRAQASAAVRQGR